MGTGRRRDLAIRGQFEAEAEEGQVVAGRSATADRGGHVRSAYDLQSAGETVPCIGSGERQQELVVAQEAAGHVQALDDRQRPDIAALPPAR